MQCAVLAVALSLALLCMAAAAQGELMLLEHALDSIESSQGRQFDVRRRSSFKEHLFTSTTRLRLHGNVQF